MCIRDRGAADNVLSHLDSGRRAELLALLKPWWRPIPAGSFDLGSEQGDADEQPIHRVTFTTDFQMLGVPVTWAMYRLFDPGHDAARHDFGGKLSPEAQDEVPVYNVSWFASVMFAEWVGARLPLDPEWEYACRAGTKTRFWSGDSDDDLARVGWIDRNSDEHPQHPVKVAGCLMGKSEVTQAQWRAVVKAAKATKDVDAAGLNEDPSDFENYFFVADNLPVENVSWCEVTRFANALSRLDGRTPAYEISDGCTVRWIDGADGYRLPTEAEWEYAARAGTTTAYATGDDEAALALAGWYGAWPAEEGGNSGGKTHDVCTAPKQPWGLCDLHGNVWEWVFDAYDSGTYARRAAASTVDGGPSTFDGSATSAETANGGASRVLRGGSWSSWPEDARSANRDWNEPSYSDWFVGFRLLLCPPERP